MTNARRRERAEHGGPLRPLIEALCRDHFDLIFRSYFNVLRDPIPEWWSDWEKYEWVLFQVEVAELLLNRIEGLPHRSDDRPA